VKEATDNYVKGIPGLKPAAQSITEKTGKTFLDTADFTKLLNESIEKLRTGKATPQDALDALQSINEVLGGKEFRSASRIKRALEVKEDLLVLLEKSNPGFKDLNRGLREAYIKREFDSLLPLNKNLSPNALRSLLAVGAIASGAKDLSEGEFKQAAIKISSALLISPKVAGLIIKLGSKAGPLGKDVSLGGLFGSKAAKGFGETAAKKTKALIKSERGALDIFPGKAGDPTVKAGAKVKETLSELKAPKKGIGNEELRKTNQKLREILAKTKAALGRK